jgi:hypothetical protein
VPRPHEGVPFLFFAAAMQLAATEPVKLYNFQVTLEEADATPCNDEERRFFFNAIERAIQTAGSKFLRRCLEAKDTSLMSILNFQLKFWNRKDATSLDLYTSVHPRFPVAGLAQWTTEMPEDAFPRLVLDVQLQLNTHQPFRTLQWQ